MLNECSLSLEQMREERNKYESVYIQFVDSQSYYNEYAFCFYEGDDAKYYDFRIKSKFGDKIISYQVENKFGVLKLLDLITKDKLDDNACTMFFVDRDYDLNTNYENENLFVTPCYSVENFYVKKECLKKILQTEFKLNEIEINDGEVITNIRHKNQIRKSIDALEQAKKGIEIKMPIDVVAVSLKEALEDLSEITGENVSEDIINNICLLYTSPSPRDTR